MAINARLQAHFDRVRSAYAVLSHEDAFTALAVARSAHVKGRRMAKVVVFREPAGGDFMVVLPADEHVDERVLRAITGRGGVRLEDENELERLFPDCESGTMPPFGFLYHMPMFVDPCLLTGDDLFFQAGNHHEIVLMRCKEYERIAGPYFIRGCLHREVAAAAWAA
jgi:Ala-tRNA(Pro) deacylase